MTVDWIWPTTADISAIRSPIKWQLQTKKEKKKNRRKTHPSVLQCDSSYQKTIWLIGTDVADVVI